MNKQQAIELVKKLTKTAGAERLRSLFQKYRMTNAPLRASSVITGMKLHGVPFLNDLVALAKDGYSSTAYADGETTTTEAPAATAGKDWMDYISQGAGVIGSLWSAISGNSSSNQVQYVPSTNAAGQVVYVPTGSSSNSGGGNAALWVILAVVGVAVVGLVIFLAVRKK
jgi:hypothetical protein